MSESMCPHCGYNLAIDVPVESAGLYVDPRGDVVWHGMPMAFTSHERAVLHTLLKAHGRIVSEAALNERLGYEGEWRLVDQIVMRVRRKLGLHTMQPPLITVRGMGWRWLGV